MSSHPQGRPVEVPNAEVGVDERTDAVHLLVPMKHDVERFGISVCGFPAEYLQIRRGLAWSDVAQSRRCSHCDADP